MKHKPNETYLTTSDLEVVSWSPGEEGENVPPTQVHILYRVAGFDALFAMRLKSKAVTDSLIDALIKHRDHVWGDK